MIFCIPCAGDIPYIGNKIICRFTPEVTVSLPIRARVRFDGIWQFKRPLKLISHVKRILKTNTHVRAVIATPTRRHNDAASGDSAGMREFRLRETIGKLRGKYKLEHPRERPRKALPGLRLLAESNPLSEPAHETLMLALRQAGRDAEALAVYYAIRDRLAAELGTAPGPGLRALYQGIRNPSKDPAT